MYVTFMGRGLRANMERSRIAEAIESVYSPSSSWFNASLVMMSLHNPITMPMIKALVAREPAG